MKTVVIKSFQHFHSTLEKTAMVDRNLAYRGVSNAAYPLIPKIGRNKDYTLRLEQDVYKLFKKHATAFLNYEPIDEWEWLAIAQHYGLATRLLDWSESPLVAAYFAVAEESGEDSAVYVVDVSMYLDLELSINRNPFKVRGDEVFIPNHIDSRITAQSGIFTIHSNPKKEFKKNVIQKIIIPAKLRKKFKGMLFVYGIHQGTLFPDLVGQAQLVNWMKGYR